ncbi:hypothetical protein SETIT_9G378600v2 [Setaria italica]|uniref:BHLH domain-containing protein n=1 Tax=Setaria italica TaxID=4555 RepID=A0A368SRX7_SETIT|nr:hypothetical protein SETIT_9G378600v2 [Setaria italica]
MTEIDSTGAAVRGGAHYKRRDPPYTSLNTTKYMEDSILFMQWAMNTLQHEHPAPAVVDEATSPSLQPLPEASYAAETVQESLITAAHAHAAATGWSSRDTTTRGGHVLTNSAWHAAPTGGSSGSGTNNLPVNWNFSAVSAELASDGTPETPIFTTKRGLPELAAYGSPMPLIRRAGLKSTGSTPTSSAPYAHDHIIAERKRREKINQRFVELSAVIPGLKKMDKATILSDATRYVKELREKLNARDAGGVVIRSSGTVVLVKRPCYAPPDDEEGAPLWAPAAVRKPLPEIDVQLSGNNVMVRVLCENGKGVVARVLAEVEDLHLSIVDASVIPFPACALNITITAKVGLSLFLSLQFD